MTLGSEDYDLDRFSPFLQDLFDGSQGEENKEDEQESISPLYDTLIKATERYSNFRAVATGGMKEIIAVYDSHLLRDVALARLKPKLGRDHYDAFLREAHITARLDHPNIIKLFDMGNDESGRPYFTMEFKRGLSLREFLSSQDGSPSSWRIQQRLQMFIKVAEAIAYAHAQNILHLDIKAENIQIGGFGDVQVCDWGLGVVVSAEGGTSTEDSWLDPDLYGPLLDKFSGTPETMAPEQQEFRNPRSPLMDIYALGVLLKDMTLSCLSEANLPKDILNSLEQIALKASAPNMDKRYSNVEAFIKDVQLLLDGYRTSVDRSTFGLDWLRSYRRHPALYQLAAGFTLIIFVGMMAFIFKLKEKNIESERLRLRAEKVSVQYREERDQVKELLKKMGQQTNRTTKQLIQAHLRSGTLPFYLLVQECHQMAKKAVRHNSSPKAAPLFLNTWFAFVMQRYSEVLDLEQTELLMNEQIHTLSRKYQSHVNLKGYLPYESFKSLLKNLNLEESDWGFERGLLEQVLHYDLSQHHRSSGERVSLVKVILEKINPEWSQRQFIATVRSGRLEIGGQGLHQFGIVGRSLLHLLNPRHLLINKSDLVNDACLMGLKLQQLSILNVPHLKLLPRAKAMPDLKHIQVSSDQQALIKWIKRELPRVKIEVLEQP